MPKKKRVYDIIPPQHKKTAKKEKSQIIKIYTNKKENPKEKKTKKRSHFWVSLVLTASFIIVIIGGYLFFKLPTATIEIWPKLEKLTLQETIITDKSSKDIDIEKKLIPAKYIEVSKKLRESFPATGNAMEEGKASGTIVLYNKYDPPTPLTLKAGTHFLSDSGKLFKCPERITIPAAQKNNGKIVPGSVEIKVEAVEGGESYNIPPANFSIPGLKGTPYYYSIYGISEKSMTGGFAGKIKKVIADDIKNAEKSLIEKAILETKEEIRKELGSDYVLLDENIYPKIIQSSSKVEAGTVVNEFEYEVSIITKGLAFKESDIKEFAKRYILSQIPKEKLLLEESIKIDYKILVPEEKSEDKLTISLNIEGGVYQKIDKNSFSLAFRKKTPEQIREILKKRLGEDQFYKIDIKLWPFWVSRVPSNQKAIKINLRFSDYK